MARDADRMGLSNLAEWFRVRGLATGLATGVVALAGIVVIVADAPTLAEGLTGRALPLVVLSGVGGLTTLWLLRTRRFVVARVSAAVSVGAIVVGWGVAQYPWLLVDEVTIADAAGAPATLTGLLIAFAVAGVLVVPALVALFVLVDRGMVSGGEDRPAPVDHG